MMPWWAWLAVGVVLLVIEVAVQTEFWLAMLGARPCWSVRSGG